MGRSATRKPVGHEDRAVPQSGLEKAENSPLRMTGGLHVSDQFLLDWVKKRGSIS